MARDHGVGGQVEPLVERLGELLSGRNHQPRVPGARQLHRTAVASVVAPQAQGQATQGRELSTLAPLRALRSRTSECARAQRGVGDGVKSCPRAGCGRSACPVVCPAKAGMFSRRQTCRGRSQSPVVWIAEAMETKTFEAYRQDLPRGGYESPGRNKSKRIVASKMSIPEGRAFNRRAKAA